MLSFYVLDNVCYNCLIKKGCWTQLGTLWWLISLWAQIGSVSTLAQQAMILSVKHPDDTVSVSVQFLHTMPSPVESWGGADQRGSTETWSFYPDLLTCSGTLARALRVAAQHRVVALPSRVSCSRLPPFTVPPHISPLTPLRAAMPWFPIMQLSWEGIGPALRALQHRGRDFSSFPSAFSCCPTGSSVEWGDRPSRRVLPDRGGENSTSVSVQHRHTLRGSWFFSVLFTSWFAASFLPNSRMFLLSWIFVLKHRGTSVGTCRAFHTPWVSAARLGMVK